MWKPKLKKYFRFTILLANSILCRLFQDEGRKYLRKVIQIQYFCISYFKYSNEVLLTTWAPRRCHYALKATAAECRHRPMPLTIPLSGGQACNGFAADRDGSLRSRRKWSTTTAPHNQACVAQCGDDVDFGRRAGRQQVRVRGPGVVHLDLPPNPFSAPPSEYFSNCNYYLVQ